LCSHNELFLYFVEEKYEGTKEIIFYFPQKGYKRRWWAQCLDMLGFVLLLCWIEPACSSIFSWGRKPSCGMLLRTKTLLRMCVVSYRNHHCAKDGDWSKLIQSLSLCFHGVCWFLIACLLFWFESYYPDNTDCTCMATLVWLQSSRNKLQNLLLLDQIIK